MCLAPSGEPSDPPVPASRPPQLATPTPLGHLFAPAPPDPPPQHYQETSAPEPPDPPPQRILVRRPNAAGSTTKADATAEAAKMDLLEDYEPY
ncbi:hypothetical protein ABZP36_003274 [Zizania latifolia]